ncbi:hypothetical protein L211DRAFT_348124 [Terfezia boudieri ATCC MYA-4762]|uniref:Uncharacterized protein n=1 Tax=Terfezia boudieri ATCC MYA-4762 TaxID=1051890 RepID=A0A3N4LKT0_9PEZI|nr:hypothetical protein L211DRAFT_348124 [Terfezia boudieri ATCC MYA-4762]
MPVRDSEVDEISIMMGMLDKERRWLPIFQRLAQFMFVDVDFYYTCCFAFVPYMFFAYHLLTAMSHKFPHLVNTGASPRISILYFIDRAYA